MGIHYTDLLHRLNINNNPVVWPEHEDIAFSTPPMLNHHLAVFVARSLGLAVALIESPGQIQEA
jgi:hypothetical protein